VPALRAPEDPFSVVEHGLPLLELLLTAAPAALPCRGLFLLDRSRLERLLGKACYAQHGQ
jgi:hypothetical protein